MWISTDSQSSGKGLVNSFELYIEYIDNYVKVHFDGKYVLSKMPQRYLDYVIQQLNDTLRPLL